MTPAKPTKPTKPGKPVNSAKCAAVHIYTGTRVRQVIDELTTRIANQAFHTSDEVSRLILLSVELLAFRDAMEGLLEWERAQGAGSV